MTDITELALREKFEAWWEREYKHLESSKYTDAVPHIKYGFWMAYQAGGAEQNELASMALAAMDSEPVACGNGCNKSKWHNIVLDIDEYMNGQDARESKGRDEIYSEIILRLTRLDVLETILRNEIGLPYGSPIPDIAEKIYDIKRARIYSVVPDDLSIFEAAIEECKKCDSIDEHAWNHGVLAVIAEYESCRAAMLHAGNSPAIPDSARDALEKALAAMEFMGDTLNNLDAVCTEDVELVAPAFDAVRRVLAAAQQEVKGE